MSEDNVALVLSLQPPADLDLALLFRNENWAALAASIYEFRDGKIVRYEGYLDQRDAFDAVGLTE